MNSQIFSKNPCRWWEGHHWHCDRIIYEFFVFFYVCPEIELLVCLKSLTVPLVKKINSVAHFWAPYRTKCPGDQILIGHGVLMMQNGRTPDLQKRKSMVVNKTGKVEVHITDNQSWNSCRKVASDHEFTFGSAIEPTEKKHDALWPCTLHGHLLQPKQGASCQHVCFALNWGLNFVGK